MYILFLFLLSIQNDVSFEYSVEQFVISSSVKPIDIPPSIIECIQLLGSDDYRARNVATKELMSMGRKAHRYLYWQINHPDLEVRWRIRKVLNSFNICLNCNGIGTCNFYKGIGDRDCIICHKSWYAHGEQSSTDCPLCENGYFIGFDFCNIKEIYK